MIAIRNTPRVTVGEPKPIKTVKTYTGTGVLQRLNVVVDGCRFLAHRMADDSDERIEHMVAEADIIFADTDAEEPYTENPWMLEQGNVAVFPKRQGGCDTVVMREEIGSGAAYIVHLTPDDRVSVTAWIPGDQGMTVVYVKPARLYSIMKRYSVRVEHPDGTVMRDRDARRNFQRLLTHTLDSLVH